MHYNDLNSFSGIIKEEPIDQEVSECTQEMIQESSMEIDIKPNLLSMECQEQDPLLNSIFTEEVEVNEEENEDLLERTCRICLHSENSMIHFSDFHEMEETVAGLYRFCTGLEVRSFNIKDQYSIFPNFRFKKTTIFRNMCAKTVSLNWKKLANLRRPALSPTIFSKII